MFDIRGKKINWIFWSVLGISLAVHAVIFIRVSGLYQAGHQLKIELLMRDISKPFVRNIPRPKNRKTNPPDMTTPAVSHENKLPTIPPVTPQIIKIPPIETLAAEKIPDSAILTAEANAQNMNMTGKIPASVSLPLFNSRDQYYQMIQQRIESAKRYPKKARDRNREGRVTVYFTILADGRIQGVKLIKKSKFESLNQAAVEAINSASPCPQPPAALFTPPVKLKLTIVFEII